MGYFKQEFLKQYDTGTWECQYCDSKRRNIYLIRFENGNERVFCTNCVEDCIKENLKFKVIKQLQ
jgi:superfamily II helicase